MNDTITFALPFFLSAAVAYAATTLSIRFSVRRRILDLPNPRSSHTRAMPRVGGIGIVSGFMVTFLLTWLLARLGLAPLRPDGREMIFVILVGGAMAVLGFYDDWQGLPPAPKYLFQVVIAVAVVAWGWRLEVIAVPFVGLIPFGILAIPLTLLWLTGFANIFNFMDGIDGLAGGTAFLYGLFFLCFASLEGNQTAALVALLVTGSALGFLPHNFPRARTFMGDTGSLFLGLLLAMLVVALADASLRPGDTLVALLLVCSVYLFDSGYTLLRRLRRRENIFRAHRSHLYQRLVQAGLSHAQVTGLYLALHALAWALALAYLQESESEAARLGILVLLFLVLVGLTLVVRRLEGRAADRVRSEKGSLS
ncbi:MAG: glycosyltransferase family 4 protein [Candidatus Acidiferrales bacterium]